MFLQERATARRTGFAMAASLYVFLALPASAEPLLAVMPFDYVDTSGEQEDQTQAHTERMELFRQVLQNDLAKIPELSAVELPCTSSGCTPANSRPIDLLDSAREAGADYIVLGTIQKMSTLISSGWVNVIDVPTGEVAVARKLSFRGDTDEAFARAANFAAKDIARNMPAGKLP
ncbi:DUF2380 domain-containing protein [Aureimonas fodinaquatilis]|uniref:DUF2380 domain-containing protein n=1 Tax=Aureimonas fodinaquatilis TaxID=2565783 RepID=A0A5B0DZT0_9HYPH|nr:DUF2380 domain-containing protein [Aureimonas fodinaquatilis]KAA0972287.1 DUF2380 domain-containing protein [Aureimonas fodinaquatilis]